VPDEGDQHLDATDVRQLLARKLTEESSRRVIGHLLAGCGACRERVREGLRRAGEEAAAYDAAFDRAVVAVLGKEGRLLDARRAEAAAGAALWQKLRDQPAGRRWTMVCNSPRYRTAGVLEALFRDYREGLWRDPAEGLELAELAMTIAEGLDAGKMRASWVADLQAEALAIAGNANRLADCPGEARRLLRQAAIRLRLGRGDLLLEGQLLSYQGSYWQSVGKFEQAARRFGRAEQGYRQIGELHLAARALVARAEAIGYLHPERGVRLIRRALREIDGARDPHLELAAHHSLAWYLNDAGQSREAQAEVGRAATLYQRFGGDAVASLSRAWLQGRIDRSLDERDQARRSYDRAWAGFAELGMGIHLTMLSIDRAELRVAEGEFGSAAALLARMVALVRRWGINRETRSVLQLLREAVVRRQCERTSFRQAALVVRRSWARDEAAGGAR
jgi:tetratricopeptide (TPR) repeat protein